MGDLFASAHSLFKVVKSLFFVSSQANFIEDVRVVLKVLTLFLPLPVFWALFDQQGSRWTLQAILMDGQLVRNNLLRAG